jgi:hypothetical protein
LTYPNSLYKYLPAEYVEETVLKGKILFRNFTYFKQQEDKVRGDYLEGSHRDNPEKGAYIERKYGIGVASDISFINSTDSDLIFMFCTSLKFSSKYFKAFNCDACIEITDPKEFCRRVRIALIQKLSTHKKIGLLCGRVSYYNSTQSPEYNIKDTTALPFLKNEIYANQYEYRLVYGTKKAFFLKQQLIQNKSHDFRAEALKGNAKSKIITIGSIEDITIVHREKRIVR